MIRCLFALCFILLGGSVLHAADQTHWGQLFTRNMVSTERDLPAEFDLKTSRNVKWVSRLGSETHSTPIIAGGRVYIGTNNDEPRNPQHQDDRGVLMCFDEKDGAFLWQLVVPKRQEDIYFDWPNSGISSSVTVEGDRVYLVSNRGEVLCLDPQAMANGNDGPYREEARHMLGTNSAPVTVTPNDADIIWLFDMTTGAGIWSHDGAHSAIIVHGDHLYLNTGTGVDNTHKKIRAPDAPSLIVLEKSTGRLVARERENIAPRIFHCTWAGPSMAKVNGKDLIFFAGGDGVLYAFEPIEHLPSSGEVLTLKKVWQFDTDPAAPKENVHRYNSNRREGPSNMFGMPVFHEDRIYVAGGGDIWWGKNEAWLKCIDATKTGDITQSAAIWSYPLNNHTMSTPAVYNGMVFIADCRRTLHCVDAASGKLYWTHELKGVEIWASPYVADGKVYLGSRRGDFWIFAADREKKVLFQTDMDAPISGTVTAANGVLYLATMTHLYALHSP